MSLSLRLVLVAFAGVLIVGARAATRHCTKLQHAAVAPPASGAPAAWAHHASFPMGHWSAVYEKPLPQPVGQQLIVL